MSGYLTENIWERCCHCISNKKGREGGGGRTPRDAHRGRIEDFRWTEIKNNIVRTRTLLRYPIQNTTAQTGHTFAHTPPAANEHSVTATKKNKRTTRNIGHGDKRE